MRTLWIAAVVLIISCWQYARAQEDEAIEPPKFTPEEVAAIAKINKTLDRKCYIDIIDTPLDQQCRDLEKLFRIKIILDPEELKKAGVAKDAHITLRVADIRLRIALQKLLDPVAMTFEVRPSGVFVKAKAAPPE